MIMLGGYSLPGLDLITSITESLSPAQIGSLIVKIEMIDDEVYRKTVKEMLEQASNHKNSSTN